MKVPFNIPAVVGTEKQTLSTVVDSGRFCGNGPLSQQCANILETRIGCKKAIMTASCTDALEMSALICNIGPGDEVIMPSYTFISTASAFALRGATIVWCDISPDTKNIDSTIIESLITPRTRAVVVVHYGGVACDMDRIVDICQKNSLLLVEDAAQAIDCAFKGRPLGSFGDLATLSFHETKNIHCGEGGALLVNRDRFVERAEILRDKGTNRNRFLRGQVDKYTWVELGSSFLMSEFQAGFLLPQLERSSELNNRRLEISSAYRSALQGVVPDSMLPSILKERRSNGHVFYIVFRNIEERIRVSKALLKEGVTAHFHYLPLHLAPVWSGKYDQLKLPVTQYVSDGLLRLPLYFGMSDAQVEYVCSRTKKIVRRLLK